MATTVVEGTKTVFQKSGASLPSAVAEMQFEDIHESVFPDAVSAGLIKAYVSRSLRTIHKMLGTGTVQDPLMSKVPLRVQQLAAPSADSASAASSQLLLNLHSKNRSPDIMSRLGDTGSFDLPSLGELASKELVQKIMTTN